MASEWQKLPAGHGTGDDKPLLGQKLPRGQGLDIAMPMLGQKAPSSQGVGAIIAGEGQ